MTAAESSISLEDVIARMVDTDGYQRICAYSDGVKQGLAGVLVHDLRCERVLTLSQLLVHLSRQDNATIIERRGWRMHTPVNVIAWDESQGGAGFRRGPA